MKKIFKSIALLAFAAGLVSCNNAAKFETYAFVSFGGTKYNVREDAGTIKIPVNLVSDKELTTTVTYTITSKSTAEEGKHYTMPNGDIKVITVSTDPAKCDSIEICPIDSTGVVTNNKTIQIRLQQVTEDNIYLSNTDSCKVTILDIDGGLFKMMGDWAGTVKGYYGDLDMSWTVEECEEGESAAFPDANLKISKGSVMSLGDGLKTETDVYCYFDEEKSELQIYPAQLWMYDLTFSDGSVLSFSIDVEPTLDGTPTPITFAYNDGTLTFNELVYYALWTRDDEGAADLCAGAYDFIKANEVLRKND